MTQDTVLELSDIKFNYGTKYPTMIVPIYPELMEKDVKLDPNLADNLFMDAAKEWTKYLVEYSKTSESITDKEKKCLDEGVYLVENTDDYAVLKPIGLLRGVVTWPNGMVKSFIVGHYGNSLYLDNHPTVESLHIDDVNMDMEKLNRFSADGGSRPYAVDAYYYKSHNLGSITAANFLAIWSILYQNEALKKI